MPPKKYNFERILKKEIKTLFLEQKIEAKKWDKTLQKQLVQEREDEKLTHGTPSNPMNAYYDKILKGWLPGTIPGYPESDYALRLFYGTPDRPPQHPLVQTDDQGRPTKVWPLTWREALIQGGGTPCCSRSITAAERSEAYGRSCHDIHGAGIACLDKPEEVESVEAAAKEDLDFIQKDQYQHGWDVGKTRAYGVPGDLISDPTPYPDTLNERLLMTYARDQYTGGSDGKCPHDSYCRRATEKRIRRLKKSLMYYRSECGRSIYRGREIREYDKEGLAACKMVVKLEYELEEREKHIPIERKNYKKEIATGKYEGDAAMRSRYLDFKDRLSNMNKEANKKAWKLRKVRRQNLYDFKKRWGCLKKTDEKEKNKRRTKLHDLWARAGEEARIRLDHLEEMVETAEQGRPIRKQNTPDQWYANIKLYWDLVDGGFIAGGNDTVATKAWRQSMKVHHAIKPSTSLDSIGGVWKLYMPHPQDWQKDPRNRNPAGLAGGGMTSGQPQPGSIQGVPKLTCIAGEEGTVDGRQGGGSVITSPKLTEKLRSLFKSSPKWAALAEKYRERFNWDASVEGRHDAAARKYALGDSLAFTRAFWQKYVIPPPNAIVCFMMHKIKSEQWAELLGDPQAMANYKGMRKVVGYLIADMYENGKLTGFLPVCSRLTRDIVDAGPPYNSKDIVVGFDTTAQTCKQMDVLGNAPGQIPPSSPQTGTDVACEKHEFFVDENGRKRLRCAKEIKIPIYANPERQEAHEVGKKNVENCQASPSSALGRPVLRYDLDKALQYFKDMCGTVRFSSAGAAQINGFGMPWAYESNIRERERATTKKQCKEIFECFGVECWEKYIPEYKEYLKFKRDCEETCRKSRTRRHCIASCMESTKEWFKRGEALHPMTLSAKIKKAKQTCRIEQDGGYVDKDGEPVIDRKLTAGDQYVPPGEAGSLDISEEDGLGLGSPFIIPQGCLPTGVHKFETTGIAAAAQWFQEMFLEPADIALEVGTGAGMTRTLLGRLLGLFALVLFAQCDDPPCHGSEEEMDIWKAKIAAEEEEARQRELDALPDETLGANEPAAYPEGKDLVPGPKEEGMNQDEQTEKMIKEEIKKIFLEQKENLPIDDLSLAAAPQTPTPENLDVYAMAKRFRECMNKNFSKWQQCLGKEGIKRVKPIASQITKELAKEKLDLRMINQLSIKMAGAARCIPPACAQIMAQLNKP